MKTKRKILLRDYRPFEFDIPEIFLDFSIHEDFIEINTNYIILPKFIEENSLRMKGKNIILDRISIDNDFINSSSYEINNEELIIHKIPKKRFSLRISSRINPYENASLEGLYSSKDILTTQCEAEGFRRIIFHPDRPDVLSKYKVRIESDRKKYPVLLSNGNKVSSKIISKDTSRHEVIWEDPFPKPSYLFALVAGNLKFVEDKYLTSSGKQVKIRIYVEEGDEKYTQHAINSLKNAMIWDEKKYKLEYDLEIYNIVAIRHFNMGAMENKSLNIFNSKLVLADERISTDEELERIESVIAHEYFHNWTGNRITCRDWFQLSLKEGLTVFRDQSFSSELHLSEIKRLEDVRFLRSLQFKEDAGPTSHPVKPVEYEEIDNFYTTTIYEKGSELIRMLQTIIGEKFFIEGVKNFLKKFDGKAATTEDFIFSTIEGAVKQGYKIDFNINHFIRWYYQSGTPYISIQRDWDGEKGILNLNIEQKTTYDKEPLIIPIKISLVKGEEAKETLLILEKKKQIFQFKNLTKGINKPIVSLFRDFSAPVNWESDHKLEELIYILENDDNLFSRWDSVQRIYKEIIIFHSNQKSFPNISNKLINSIRKILDKSLNNTSYSYTLLCLPTMNELELNQAPIDPISLYESRLALSSLIGESLNKNLLRVLKESSSLSLQKWPKGVSERKLIALVWKFIIDGGNKEILSELSKSVSGSSMTLSISALKAMANIDCLEREKSLNIFYDRWKDNPIVLDSWFNLKASIYRESSLQEINELLKHPRFDPIAPNSIRAIFGGLASNIMTFHNPDGTGYMFMAEQIISIDKRNPITASKLCKVFNRWQSYIEPNKNSMLKAILCLKESELSSNSLEVVNMMLKDIL